MELITTLSTVTLTKSVAELAETFIPTDSTAAIDRFNSHASKLAFVSSIADLSTPTEHYVLHDPSIDQVALVGVSPSDPSLIIG